MHILMSFDSVPTCNSFFTEKDDNPKAEWQKGITQSLVDDDLVNLADSRTKVHKITKYRRGQAI